MSERLLTVPEAAVALSLNAQTVREWLRTGKLRGLRTGDGQKARWRVPESAIEQSLRPAPTQQGVVSREEAKQKGFGFLKGRIKSSGDFLEAKHEQSQMERQRDERRMAERKVAA
jgi:excisionase family DNA binding protein